MPEDTLDRLERYRHRYAEVVAGWMPATAQFQRWVTARTDADARVLDLGCGRGGIVERLGTQGHWTGADPDLASVKAHRWPDLRRCCANAESLPFPEAHFDLVVSSWVLEHLSRPEVSFREVARVLKHGGSFIFLTPNAAHPLPWLSRKLASLHRMQQRWVSTVYDRDAEDTFPVVYRANTYRDIECLAAQTDLRLVQLAWIADPSYLAWNRLTFWLAAAVSMLPPITWKVHLIGELAKP